METRRNLHVPLSPELHRALRAEAERTRQPATRIVREAIAHWLMQRKRTMIHEQIATYAAEHAATDVDLDTDLEAASIESLRDEDEEA